MKVIARFAAMICVVLVLLLLAGCSHTKAAGTWVSSAGAAGEASLELKSDGTGTIAPDGAIKWTEDGNTIKIFQAAEDPSTATPTITGTLSDDQKQLTLAVAAGSISDNEVLTRKE